MSQLRPLAIDLAYRPESYFWAYDNNIKLASDIKCAEKREAYMNCIQDHVMSPSMNRILSIVN